MDKNKKSKNIIKVVLIVLSSLLAVCIIAIVMLRLIVGEFHSLYEDTGIADSGSGVFCGVTYDLNGYVDGELYEPDYSCYYVVDNQNNADCPYAYVISDGYGNNIHSIPIYDVLISDGGFVIIRVNGCHDSKTNDSYLLAAQAFGYSNRIVGLSVPPTKVIVVDTYSVIGYPRIFIHP